MGSRYIHAALIAIAHASPIAVAWLIPPRLDAQPAIAGCPVFPADSVWNTPVDQLPLDPNSGLYLASLGPASPLHPDFGAGLFNGGPIGIPFIVVPGSTVKVPAVFQYAGESDPGPYAVPLNAPIEGGAQSSGDRHAIAVDRDNCILYELYDAHPQADGSWRAGSGAIFDLRSHRLRPAGWTSADAAGLPIVPGLVRYEEVASGEIRHAIRFTVRRTRRAYVWPARHFASSLTDMQYPPMGQRFRLRTGYDISGFHPENQVILRAMKKYGMILADNGSDLFISGAPDERWNNTRLRELRRVTGADFEAVDSSTLMLEPGSGQARQPATTDNAPVLHGATFLRGALAPNLIVSIFGTNLSTIGTVAQVSFDSRDAVLLYVSPTQLNAVVPASVAGRGSTQLLVRHQGITLLDVNFPVAATNPGIFGILNQDYSINSESNPAAPGSIVMIFGTGGGINQQHAAGIGASELRLFYAGAAPQLPGVDQLNVEVPPLGNTAGRAQLTWKAGENTSPAFPLWVR